MLWWREKFPRLWSILCNEFEMKYDPPVLSEGIQCYTSLKLEILARIWQYFMDYFVQAKIGVVLHGRLKKLSGLYVGRTESQWSPLAASMCYQDMAEDVVSFLDLNGLQRIIFMGHSLAGKTAMQFAVQFPERVLSLIMVDIAPVQYKHRQKILELIEAMLELQLPKKCYVLKLKRTWHRKSMIRTFFLF